MLKYLIVGPSWVGDMVMSQSLYKRIRLLHPDSKIDVLAPGWCKPILERMPEVNNAIEMPVGHGKIGIKARWRLGRSFSLEAYTHAIIQPNSAKSALVPLFAGIRTRTGWKGEFRYGLLNDLRPSRKVFQFMVERYVALAHSKEDMQKEVRLESIDTPSLTVDPVAQSQAIKRLELSNDRATVGLCPGAEFGPAKRWPDSHYAQVASKLIKAGQQVWIFGSAKDSDVAEKIIAALPDDEKVHCINLAGKTSLIEAVDLIAACHTVISNDSGLMHVAAAVKCNIIAIYGSSSPKYTPPLANKVRIVSTQIDCRPCFKRECPLGHLNCLTHLGVEQVLDAFNELNPTPPEIIIEN